VGASEERWGSFAERAGDRGQKWEPPPDERADTVRNQMEQAIVTRFVKMIARYFQ
jgi:hypothetical protein